MWHEKTYQVQKNGLIFKIPLSPFSSRKYAVHPSGNGSAWVENIDVDQPHGLDYRAWNHLAIGVRKRLEKGHQTLGDTTAGGEHIPGGSGVLGMEITDTGGDITSPVASDGTYQGRGLVWAYDGSQNARLWCSTEAAESTAATDFTVLLMNPDKQWGGGDVTWAGAHQFDGSMVVTGAADFSDAVFDGSVDISGALDCSVLNVDGTADFSSVGVDGTATLADVSISGWLGVDGSADFSDCYVDGDLTVKGAVKVAGDASHSSFASAWGHADWTTGTVHAGYNVANVDYTSDGVACVSFTNNLSSQNYVTIFSIDVTVGDAFAYGNNIFCISKTTSGFRCGQCDNGVSLLAEATVFNFVVFG